MPDVKCPCCSKAYVARVARVGFGEELLSLFYIYPFKCQLCGCRFKAFQWGVRYLRVEEDRREYERLPTTFPLSYSGEKDGIGMAYDVCMSGCSFEAAANAPRQGSILFLALRISSELPPVEVEALVRNVAQNRVGVEFLRLEEAEKARLQDYVRDLLRRRTAPSIAPQDATAPSYIGFQRAPKAPWV